MKLKQEDEMRGEIQGVKQGVPSVPWALLNNRIATLDDTNLLSHMRMSIYEDIYLQASVTNFLVS